MAQGSPAVNHTAPTNGPATGALPAEAVQGAVQVLKAVGHPLRFRICSLLARHPALSVTELCDELSTKQPIISQQLSILRRGRVVDGRRIGNRVLYSLTRKRVGRIVRMLQGEEDTWEPFEATETIRQ
jgi:ArsR family transcriptional regulator